MSAAAQRKSTRKNAAEAAKILTLEEFKRSPSLGSHVRKGTGLRVEKADGEGGGIVFCISTAAVDRHGDTIDQDGWELKSYEGNPVILWNHDSWTPPIGQSTKVWVEDGKLKAAAKFAQGYELAETIEKLIRGGFIRAASVGFTALEYEFNEERDDGESWFPPVDFKRQELREWSPVSIPANPEALVEAKAAGVELRSYRKWLEQAMDATHGKGAYAFFERSWKAIAEAKTYSVPRTKSAADANAPAEEPSTESGSTPPAPVAEPQPAVEPAAPVAAPVETPREPAAAPAPTEPASEPAASPEPPKSIDPDALANAIAAAVGQHASDLKDLLANERA